MERTQATDIAGLEKHASSVKVSKATDSFTLGELVKKFIDNAEDFNQEVFVKFRNSDRIPISRITVEPRDENGDDEEDVIIINAD